MVSNRTKDFQAVIFVRDGKGNTDRQAKIIKAMTRQSAENRMRKEHGPQHDTDGNLNWTIGQPVHAS